MSIRIHELLKDADIKDVENANWIEFDDGVRFVRERTCKLVDTVVEHDNGVMMRGVKCTACGHFHEGELGWFWYFCPKCGAAVVD